MHNEASKDYRRMAALAKRVNTFLGEVVMTDGDEQGTTSDTKETIQHICKEMKAKTAGLKASLAKMAKLTKA